jgi:hypothetical protein
MPATTTESISSASARVPQPAYSTVSASIAAWSAPDWRAPQAGQNGASPASVPQVGQ